MASSKNIKENMETSTNAQWSESTSPTESSMPLPASPLSTEPLENLEIEIPNREALAQPCTPIDLQDLDQNTLIFENPDPTVEAISNDPQQLINTILHDAIRNYNNQHPENPVPSNNLLIPTTVLSTENKKSPPIAFPADYVPPKIIHNQPQYLLPRPITTPVLPTPRTTPSTSFTPDPTSIPLSVALAQLPYYRTKPFSTNLPPAPKLRTTVHSRLTNPTNTESHLYPHVPTPQQIIDHNRDRDIKPPLYYPHLYPINHTITQNNLQATPYLFKIPHDTTEEDSQIGKITKQTSHYNLWFNNHHSFSHFQFNFIKPTKQDQLQNITTNTTYSHILNIKRQHQYSYETFYNHHQFTNKKFTFVSEKHATPFSIDAKYHLDSTYCYGKIRQYDPIKDYFMYYIPTNPDRPLLVPREALSTHDSENFYIYHSLPPKPIQKTTPSPFHPYISTTPPKTTNHIYEQLLHARLTIPQLHLIITNMYHKLHTTTRPANNPTPTHDTPATQHIIRQLCSTLQESDPTRFNDILITNQNQYDDLLAQLHELEEKLHLYKQFYKKVSTVYPFLEQMTKDLTEITKNLPPLTKNLDAILTTSTDLP